MDVYGLIGNPVGHSLSPPMHEAAYAACDIDARYVTFEPAAEELEDALSGAAALGIRGLNVTIPFKQTAHTLVDPTPLADRIGAVNTITFDDRLVGYNTDASGAVRALRHHDVTLSGARAVVVGAGGAGRAITVGLADAGCSVSLANRTESKAHAIAEDLESVSGHPLAAVPELLERATLLVNATSVGMDETASPVETTALHADLTVMDAVYSPLETTLLAAAKEVGATTIDGGWMLLFQGAEAFEHWTGQEAPVETMNAALRDELA